MLLDVLFQSMAIIVRIGVCDEGYFNTKACGHDKRESDEFNSENSEYPIEILVRISVCDGEYFNTKARGHDKRECDEFNSENPEFPIGILASKFKNEAYYLLDGDIKNACDEGGRYT